MIMAATVAETSFFAGRTRSESMIDGAAAAPERAAAFA
jgi:hypothetical protein